jgi:hypothetical protein
VELDAGETWLRWTATSNEPVVGSITLLVSDTQAESVIVTGVGQGPALGLMVLAPEPMLNVRGGEATAGLPAAYTTVGGPAVTSLVAGNQVALTPLSGGAFLAHPSRSANPSSSPASTAEGLVLGITTGPVGFPSTAATSPVPSASIGLTGIAASSAGAIAAVSHVGQGGSAGAGWLDQVDTAAATGIDLLPPAAVPGGEISQSSTPLAYMRLIRQGVLALLDLPELLADADAGFETVDEAIPEEMAPLEPQGLESGEDTFALVSEPDGTLRASSLPSVELVGLTLLLVPFRDRLTRLARFAHRTRVRLRRPYLVFPAGRV